MDKPIRVLQIFTILNRGGAESMIMNYYRNIDRTKIQFDFLVHREDIGIFEDEIEKLGGNIFRLPAINPLSPQKYYQALEAFLDTHTYQIIHSHINTFSLYPLKVAKNKGVNIRIAHAHTTTQALTPSFILRKPMESLKILFKGFNKYAVKREASHLFSCGKKAGDWLFGSSPYSIVPNAIDISKYIYNKEKDQKLRTQFDLEDKFVVGHVGNFTHPKNYPFILNSFKSIKERKNNSKLILIGKGKMETEIKELASSMDILGDILFLGSRQDVPDLLQMMNIFLFPSFYEGLPVTLIEAQAAGLKIFASDTISQEVAVTNDISFLSLEKSYDFWADQIVAGGDYIRSDNTESLKLNGYDVIASSRELEKFYQDNYSSDER